MAYDLLLSKHSSVYGEMLRALRAECIDLHLVPIVQHIVADCERGIYGTVTTVLWKIFLCTRVFLPPSTGKISLYYSLDR